MTPSLALYLHFPWCIKKCPYCDFNSHQRPTDFSDTQSAYVETLCQSLQSWSHLSDHTLCSVFFGGGTPSLLTPEQLASILGTVRNIWPCVDAVEITLESNPGATERGHLKAFHELGINRLSIGAQSFHPQSLHRLGRIHQSDDIATTVHAARDAGFTNLNLDLMYALPEQTSDLALADLQAAIALQPEHLSWYHLTLEPNTPFWRHPPALPSDEVSADIESLGQQYLKTQGYHHYEISAWAQPHYTCRHNQHYWQFGDYLGIGAGAHSKLTLKDESGCQRFTYARHPRHFLRNPQPIDLGIRQGDDLCFEWLLCRLRLFSSIAWQEATDATGLNRAQWQVKLSDAVDIGWIKLEPSGFALTDFGRRFLDECLQSFLPETDTDG